MGHHMSFDKNNIMKQLEDKHLDVWSTLFNGKLK
jgi:hypothetical protein